MSTGDPKPDQVSSKEALTAERIFQVKFNVQSLVAIELYRAAGLTDITREVEDHDGHKKMMIRSDLLMRLITNYNFADIVGGIIELKPGSLEAEEQERLKELMSGPDFADHSMEIAKIILAQPAVKDIIKELKNDPAIAKPE